VVLQKGSINWISFHLETTGPLWGKEGKPMKKLLTGLGLLIVILIVVGGLTGFFANHPGLVAGLAVAGVFLMLLAGLVVGSIYSAWLMRTGARIATEDHQANAAIGAAYTGFAREMVRHLGRIEGKASMPGQAGTPALPLPGQGDDWLPMLREFEQPADSVDSPGQWTQ
jgi:hypothetical protein